MMNNQNNFSIAYLTGNYYHCNTTVVSRKKRHRTALDMRQLVVLEQRFMMSKYLTSSERINLSIMLNLSETQVSCSFNLINHFLKSF